MKKTTCLIIGLVMALAFAQSTATAQQGQGQRRGMQFDQSAYTPKLFVNLPEWCHNPDGMTVCEESGNIYMNCPNFNNMKDGKKEFPATLNMITPDGKFEKLLEYPPMAGTNQCGPMGLDFGPDGNLYVCDNQYFHDKDHKSRILCVEMKDGKPTGKITTVVDGVKLANAIMWHNNEMWVTDSCLDLEGYFGVGGLWRFKADEILKQTEPLKVLPNGKDEHLVVIKGVKKIGREDTTGADGMTVDNNGVIYFGNFGDGVMYAVTVEADDSVKCVTILDDEQFQCCDGIFFDAATSLIFINDSQKNSIRAMTILRPNAPANARPNASPNRVFSWTIWENDDTDGTDGLLDQPCECVIVDGKMIIANFDYPFPGLRNAKFDAPYTMSVIDMKPLQERMQQMRSQRRNAQ
jgi:SMP-30/Gluconolaconase/LRE-like region.